MYFITKLALLSEDWSDVLLAKDWSVLKDLILSNHGNIQCSVMSLMITS